MVCKNRAYDSGENDPDSFVDFLHSIGSALFSKNRRVFGNYVLIGKRGFDIIKKDNRSRVEINCNTCVIDSLMTVRYIPSME